MVGSLIDQVCALNASGAIISAENVQMAQLCKSWAH